MKRLAVWVLAAVAAVAAHALEYKTVDIRKTGGSPVRETFWAGDSIAFGYALEEDGYSYDLGPWDMVTWEVCAYTNPAQCWMAVTGRVDDAESGELSVETTLPLSVVPVGQYRGYVKGLKVTESNTVARQRVLVEQTVTVRYGQTEFPPDVEDNGGIIEGNAYVRQSALDAEAAARMRADTIMSNAIAVISSQGGGEPVWPLRGFLPAEPDEDATNEAYKVEYPTTHTAPFGVEGDIKSSGDVEAMSMTLNGKTIYAWGGQADYSEDIARNSGNIATNAAKIAAVDERIDTRIDSLYGVCRGGWKWEDYYVVNGYEAGVSRTVATNESPPYATNTSYNVVYTLSRATGLLGWLISERTIRKANESDSIMWEPVSRRRAIRSRPGLMPSLVRSIDPKYLEVSGNIVMFKDGVTPEDIGGGPQPFASVRGTLGGYTGYTDLDFDVQKQSTSGTVYRFVGPAPGTLLDHCYSNILVAASNAYAQGKQDNLRLWPQGYGSGTNHVPATWNTDCWAYGMGDFSCVSYHAETPAGYKGGGVYLPLTMVTPRHAVCANHWKPIAGMRVYFVTKSGTVATNRVSSYYNIRGDLTVARLETPFDTNEVGTATLLQSDFVEFLYGTTNTPLLGLGGVPCISFDCAERVRVSFWRASGLMYGRTDKARSEVELENYYASGLISGGGKYEGPYSGNGVAVGGDSGSPSFLIADGKALLLGCFHTAPGGGPMPHKEEVDKVIRDIWNDPETCEEYSLSEGGWYSPERPQPPL